MCLQTSHACKLSIRGKTKVALTKEPCPACPKSRILVRGRDKLRFSSRFTSWDFDCCLIVVMALANDARDQGITVDKFGQGMLDLRCGLVDWWTETTIGILVVVGDA